MIPLLIKPTIQGIRNRLRSRYDSTSNYIQDLFIFGFGIGIMGVIFYSTSLMIAKIQDFHDYLYLPPADPLGLIFLILMAMVVMSGAALSVGSLFLSNDLDLLLSAPIHPFTFTFGKFTHIFLMSSWMPILFLAPFLVAFGVMYEASAIFYLVTAVSLIPFFMIPNCIAVMIACIYTRLVPAHRTKEVLIVCSIIALGAILLVLETLNLNSSTLSSAEELFRIITLISMSDLPWLPSSWLGQILSSFLDGKPFPTPYIVLLFSTALSLTALTTMILELSHREGYSKARNLSQGSILFRRQRGDKSRLPNLFPIHTALITKEWKSVVRDMTQVTQLLFLLGLSVFYFYNLRVFKAVDALPVANQLSWRQFLSIGNICMGSFLITAFSTRFVFPSVSLEGRSYWLLATGPIKVKDLLRAKFFCWLIPVAAFASLFYVTGAYTIGVSNKLILANFLCAIVISIGVVGLAIGLGAYFANLDWEYSTELTASFGSLVYMLTSIMLIFISLGPALMFGSALHRAHRFGPIGQIGIPIACALILFGINFFAARWALYAGTKKLERYYG